MSEWWGEITKSKRGYGYELLWEEKLVCFCLEGLEALQLNSEK